MPAKPIEELIAPEDREVFALLRQKKISFEEFLEKIKNPRTLDVINAHLIGSQFKILWENINDLKKRIENIEKHLGISRR
jgi:DNA-binding transcriptional ArsR family regulator